MINKTTNAEQLMNDGLTYTLVGSAVTTPLWGHMVENLIASYEILFAIGGLIVLGLTIWNKWWDHRRIVAEVKKLEKENGD